MVFTAFVLFTVSSLAVHGKEVSTEGPIVPRGCEGKAFCNIKPADYPQNEIDSFLESNPAFVRRMKRETELAGWSDDCDGMEDPGFEAPNETGNCKTDITCEHPFLQVTEARVPHVIVQSQFFTQKIRQVRCAESERPCFEDFTRNTIKTKCQPRSVSTTLFVYDKEQNIVQNVTSQIYVDCVCVTF